MSRGNSVVYQLTSSAITYNLALPMGWVLGAGVVDEGESPDNYHFKRLALYSERNYALIKVDAPQGKAEFQLYGPQSVSHPQGATGDLPITHSMMKLELVLIRKRKSLLWKGKSQEKGVKVPEKRSIV